MPTSTVEDTIARLPLTFDPERLRRDLEEVKNVAPAPQPGPYHSGEWTGISLRSVGGRQSTMPSAPGLEPYMDTEALSRTPYFREVLDSLRSPLEVVRILALPPGGEIRPHYDFHTNFQFGLIRLHLPIVTHPDVIFTIDEHRCTWLPGELWYGDFSRSHSVKNQSMIVRYHMVIDTQINEFILSLFPADFVTRRRAEGISMATGTIACSQEVLRKYICNFMVPSGLVPLLMPGKNLMNRMRPTRGSVRIVEEKLIVFLEDNPTFGIEPTLGDRCSILGLSGGCMLQFAFRNNDVSGLHMILRGVQEDLFSARLGRIRGEARPERRIELPLVSV